MRTEEIKNFIKVKYGKIAEQDAEDSSCCGSSCCDPQVDYTVFSESYKTKEGYIPGADLSLGCGIPTDYSDIKKGDHVLDLGSGAGIDCFVARALVGETGKVTGLDMTEQMIKKARHNCEKLKYDNVEFVLGEIEEMPFENNMFDVVISNCVLNLVPDKRKAFKEIFRVLKPTGRFCVSDIVIKGTLPEKLKKDAEMYAGCVAGASEMGEYLEMIKNTGFVDIIVHKEIETGLPESILAEYCNSDELSFYQTGKTGIYSITVSAKKPVLCNCREKR